MTREASDDSRWTDADAIVIGGGIAGASTAYFLAPHAKVVVLERESYVGFHATGRSAALFLESYGSEQVRMLTRASRSFFESPPSGFTEHRLLTPRGTVTIGDASSAEAVSRMFDTIRPHAPQARLLDSQALQAKVPVLLSSHAHLGVEEPDAADVDVNELHLGFLRGMRAAGGLLRCEVAIDSIDRVRSDWVVRTRGGAYRAPVIVNAAGAWVDEVAGQAGVRPIGIEPRRRSAFMFSPPVGLDASHWPMVMDINENFHFKPDAGMILGSSANADLVAPHDVQPEELDIALGIHHIEQATTMRILRPTRTWAGLRSFIRSGDLVGGFSPDAEGFFWVAAQGGYGIQTAPAMGLACAELILGRPLPNLLQDFGLTVGMLAPQGLTVQA
jgi:D-arginine dehydrogenase